MSNDFVPPGGPAPAGPPEPGAVSGSAGSVPQYQPPAPYGSVQQQAARPKQVDISVWLYLAAAALSLVALIVSLLSLDAAREEAMRQLEQQGQGEVLPPEAVEGAIWAAFAIGVVFSLLFAALYVLFAVLVRRGYGWARYVLGAFAVLAVFGVLDGLGLGALRFLCLAAATVLVFLPVSNAYFRSTAAARATGRG